MAIDLDSSDLDQVGISDEDWGAIDRITLQFHLTQQQRGGGTDKNELDAAIRNLRKKHLDALRFLKEKVRKAEQRAINAEKNSDLNWYIVENKKLKDEIFRLSGVRARSDTDPNNSMEDPPREALADLKQPLAKE